MGRSVNPTPLTKRMLRQLGENIRIARLRRDLSLRDVAQRAGVALKTVVSVENGEAGTSIGAVTNILHSLGLAQDISQVAKDDELGRKLQDLNLDVKRKRAPKKTKSTPFTKDEMDQA